MSYTLQQKFDFLMRNLVVYDVDYWEKDAMLGLHSYFQFNGDEKPTKEQALEYLMQQGWEDHNGL